MFTTVKHFLLALSVFAAAMLGVGGGNQAIAEKLGLDDAGKPIQALALSTAQGAGATVEVVTTNTSTSTATAAITTTGASGDSTVRVVCSTDSYIAAGTSPTAASTTSKMPAWAIEYFTLGSGQKMAFLAINAAGSCDVTKML